MSGHSSGQRGLLIHRNLGRWIAGGLLLLTIGLALSIQWAVFQSIGWFIGALGLIALLFEAFSFLFLRLSRIAGVSALLICLPLTASIELAYYKQEISETTEVRESITQRKIHLDREIEGISDRLWSPRPNSVAFFDAKINEMLLRQIRFKRKWMSVARATNHCALNHRLTSRYCQQIIKLRTERARSTEYVDLVRLQALKIKERNQLSVSGVSNPLAQSFADLIRLNWEVTEAEAETVVRLFYVFAIHGFLLVSSHLCFNSSVPSKTSSVTESASHIQRQPRKKRSTQNLQISSNHQSEDHQRAERFLNKKLKASDSDYMDLKPAYDQYKKHCAQSGERPLSVQKFNKLIEERALHSRRSRGSPTGGLRYWGIRLD